MCFCEAIRGGAVVSGDTPPLSNCASGRTLTVNASPVPDALEQHHASNDGKEGFAGWEELL